MKKKPAKTKASPARTRARSARGRAPRRASAPRVRPPAPAPVVEAIPVEDVIPAALDVAAAADIILSAPEPDFAARVPPPEAERPFPTRRRAIFFDVENTSRPGHISRVLEHLAVDRVGRRTDFVAVGNWKVIGHDTARLLARHGAQLVHSAPATGVRDWSDLRIAVAAGAWLAGARPGDVMEIVTNDRAFDAVGDVATGLGITFRRLSHEGLAGAAPTDAPPPAPPREHAGDSRSRRRRRGRGPWRGSSRPTSPPSHERPPVSPQPPPPPPPPPPPESTGEGEAEPHTAPHDEIIAVVQDLMARAPGRPVTIDSLANALKRRGFSRPPGSPRLITRIRRIREIHLDRSGVITLGESGARSAEPAVDAAPEIVEPVDAGGPEPIEEPADAAAPPTAAQDEDDDRGNRMEEMLEEDDDRGNRINAAPAPAAAAQQRRRPRRGRRRRRPGATGATVT